MIKNQTKHVDRYMVQVVNIIGTDLWFASAWERIDGSPFDGKFGTITTSGPGIWYGKIGTNPDKSQFDHLPSNTIERWNATMAAYDAKYAEAYNLIYDTMPWIKDYNLGIRGRTESMGEVRFTYKKED